MERRVALITGVTGQDGAYLTELLLKKGYEVHGMARRTSSMARDRIDGLRARAESEGRVFELHYGDLGDATSLHRIVMKVRPTELYNLGGQSHVAISFQQPEYTNDVLATGVLRLLEAIRNCELDTRFYQASTSELFGKVEQKRQDEQTPFHPRSPYAVSKLYAYWLVRHYREAYGMHASNGILFNHESPLRGENFVTRKITLGLASILAGKQERLRLGNLNARRDWGFAGDFVEAMWLMVRRDEADDFAVATGESHSVREFVQRAAEVAGLAIEWEGEGGDEIGREAVTGRVLIKVDPRYYRPTDVDHVEGDASKARRELGWQPRVTFDELVEMMMVADLERLNVRPSITRVGT